MNPTAQSTFHDGTPKANSRRPRQSGFTLAEVMMSTLIMAMGISTSIIALQSTFKQIDVARGTTLAAQIIQSEMERIRMMPWNNTTTEAVDSISELPASEVFDGSVYLTTLSRVTGHYTITRTVTEDSDRPTEVKNIHVSVTWRSYDNRQHTRNFRSIYAKNGLYDFYYTIAHP